MVWLIVCYSKDSLRRIRPIKGFRGINEKGWSQGDLAKKSCVSRDMIGKYERGEAVLSIEVAKKIASALGVTLDYLAGEASSAAFDRRTVERFQDIEKLNESEKDHVFALLDAFLVKSKMQAILK